MIRKIMLKLFSVTGGDVVFTWLSWWHLSYLAVIFGGTMLAARRMVGRQKLLRFLGYAVPAVYIADFFLMPFASDGAVIQIFKLPFHACTVLAVVIPFVQFNGRFCKWKLAVAVMAVTCSFLFLLYPGSSLKNYTPWCYLVLQTHIFHGLMFSWGVLTLTAEDTLLSFQTLRRVAVLTMATMLWASFGNAAYSHGTVQYDWFMLTGQSLPFALSTEAEKVLPFVMPGIVFGVVVGVSAVVIAVARFIKHRTLQTKTAQASV